jgi:hypothetical protein
VPVFCVMNNFATPDWQRVITATHSRLQAELQEPQPDADRVAQLRQIALLVNELLRPAIVRLKKLLDDNQVR